MPDNHELFEQLDRMEAHLLTIAEQGEDAALDLARIQGSRRTLQSPATDAGEAGGK